MAEAVIGAGATGTPEASAPVGGPSIRFLTPTGAPCPRQLRPDLTVEGSGHCYGCGSCLLLETAVWP